MSNISQQFLVLCIAFFTLSVNLALAEETDTLAAMEVDAGAKTIPIENKPLAGIPALTMTTNPDGSEDYSSTYRCLL